MSILIKAIDENYIKDERLSHSIYGIDDISNDASEVINSITPPNYLSFDGLGINLVDDNKKFYEDGDYIGLIEKDNLFIEMSTWNSPFSRELVIEFYDNSCKCFDLYISNPLTQMEFYNEIYIKNGIAKIDISDLTYRVWLQHFLPRYPNQKVKIASISIGGITIFQKANNISLLEEINVISDDLPINSFSADIVADEFAFAYNTKLCILNNGKNYGEFYLNDSEKIDNNIFQIIAENSIKKLEETEYADWSISKDLNNLINDISTSTSTNIIGPDDIDSYGLFGHLPIKSARYALCAGAFVTGLMIDASRSSDILLKPIPTTVSSYIDAKRIIGNATFKREKDITSANYEYVQRSFSYIEKMVEPKNDANVRMKYIYDNPSEYFSLNLEEGMEITVHSESDNYIDFISPQENIKIPVIELTYPKSSITIINPLASSSARPNTKKFDSFGLLGIKNTKIIPKENDILKFIQSEGKIKAKIILKNERVGELVQIETAFDGIKTGIIISMDIHLGYKDVADIEVLEWKI